MSGLKNEIRWFFGEIGFFLYAAITTAGSGVKNIFLSKKDKLNNASKACLSKAEALDKSEGQLSINNWTGEVSGWFNDVSLKNKNIVNTEGYKILEEVADKYDKTVNYEEKKFCCVIGDTISANITVS